MYICATTNGFVDGRYARRKWWIRLEEVDVKSSEDVTEFTSFAVCVGYTFLIRNLIRKEAFLALFD